MDRARQESARAIDRETEIVRSSQEAVTRQSERSRGLAFDPLVLE